MAEPTKVKIYNFGDRKLDYGKYITNLENNVESYLQNQRDTEGWDDNRVQEFRNSFGEILSHFRGDYQGKGTRFSTNQMGSIIDSEGFLNDTDGDDYYYNNKGERINKELYDALKDRKRRRYNSFEANREVAEYFRRIGSYMKDYEDTTEKFDISKHGFNAWLMNKEAPGGTFNYQNYWDLDPVDEKTGKRGTAKREAMAAKWMEDYLTEMKDKTFNFEGNKSFSSMEDYINKGNEVLNEWKKSGWGALDKINAQRLGVDNDFITKFFGVEGNPNLSPEENAAAAALREQLEKADAEQKTLEQQTKEYNDWVEQLGMAYYNSGYRSAPFSVYMPDIHKYYDFDNDDLFQSTEEKPDTDYDLLLKNFHGDVDENVKQYIRNMYNPNPNFFNRITTRQHYAFLPWALRNYGIRLEDGRYYIPVDSESVDYKRNSALVFNPKTRQFQYMFIGDLPGQEEWNRRKQAYLQSKQPEGSRYAAYREEGGILKYQNGRAISYEEYKRQRDELKAGIVKKKAEAKGRTVEQQKEAERKAHTPFAGGQEDNTWSVPEYARLIGAIDDIVAAGAAFVPGWGTAVSGAAGIKSTILNGVADAFDSSIGWGDVFTNFGTNLGMDALGLIPYGGSAGKFAKILKNIGKYIPRLMAVIGTYGAFKNRDAIMGSFQKAIDDPANLTVEDWLNMAQGIGVATGLTAGGGRALQKKAKGNPDIQTDFAAIQLQSKANPNKTVNHIVGKKTAIDLRAAKNANEMLEILYRDNPWLRDNYVVKQNTGLYGRPIQPSWKNKSLFGESVPQIYEVRRDKHGNLFGYNPSKWKGDLALYDNGKGGQSFKRTSLGTALPEERQGRIRDYEKVRAAVGSPQDKSGVRRYGYDEDFNEAYWKSLNDLADASNKKPLLESQQARRQQEVDNQKSFRDKNGSTQDITNRLNASRTLRGSADYQTAIGQHAALTQSHRDLVARHQPIIDSNRKQIEQIDKDLLFYNNLRSSASKADRDTANKEIRRLTRLRQQLQTDIDSRAAELVASETKVKDNQARIDAGSDQRITELENLKKQSEDFDKKLTDIDTEISRLEKLGGQHTPTYVELLHNRAKEGKITFTDERGKIFQVDAQRAMRVAGIRKHGGTLNRVYKFLGGTPGGGVPAPTIANVTNKGATWFGNMMPALTANNWWEQFATKENYLKFNDLQRSWFENHSSTGYQGEEAIYSDDVKARLELWDATGGNAPIDEMRKKGLLVGNDGTDDKPDKATGKFGMDGYFGEQEYLRHGGHQQSWGTTAEDKQKLEELLKYFAEKGFKYEIDPTGETTMYMLTPMEESEKPAAEKPAAEKPGVEKPKNSFINTPGKKTGKNAEKANALFSKAREYFGDPNLLANMRLFSTLSQIDREKELDKKKQPYLKEIVQPHLYVRKDFMAIQNARKALGTLAHRILNEPVDSDGAKLRSLYFDGLTSLLDYGIQGNQLADAKFWETSDASKANEIQNLEKSVANRNDNMATLIEKQHNDINSEEVADYKKTTALNNRMYELLAKAEQEQLERKEAQKRADAMLLENDVTFNLDKYAQQFGISPEEVAVWNKVQAGTVPSKLPTEELKLWESVYRKVNYGKGLLSAQLSGAVIGNFGLARAMATKSTKPVSPTAYDSNAPSWAQFDKDGAKIAAKSRVKVAKIRERIKNADRAARAMEKNLDRVQKTVESINKRMYGVKR